MEETDWAEERDRIREEALKNHERLSRLFVEDRLAFERERKNTVDGLIGSLEDPEMRARMRTLQDSWDRKMKHAGSKENRFVLAKAFFWEHFHEVWKPALQEFNALLNGDSDP